MKEESPIVVPPTHGGRRLYTILTEQGENRVIARDAVHALRKVKLLPGSIVTVFVPSVVHIRRARNGI